jgi:hypothetical protein
MYDRAKKSRVQVQGVPASEIFLLDGMNALDHSARQSMPLPARVGREGGRIGIFDASPEIDGAQECLGNPETQGSRGSGGIFSLFGDERLLLRSLPSFSDIDMAAFPGVMLRPTLCPGGTKAALADTRWNEGRLPTGMRLRQYRPC